MMQAIRLRVELITQMIPCVLIEVLSIMFLKEVVFGKRDDLMELLNIRMEEGTNLEDHLKKVTSTMDHMIGQLDCWIKDEILIHVVLRS